MIINPIPKSSSGKSKRRWADEMQSISGKGYCTSCQRTHPKEDVMRFRPAGKATVRAICKVCYERRKRGPSP